MRRYVHFSNVISIASTHILDLEHANKIFSAVVLNQHKFTFGNKGNSNLMCLTYFLEKNSKICSLNNLIGFETEYLRFFFFLKK